MQTKPTNLDIAAALEKLADRLAEREANPHRVQAYQYAAQTIRHAEQPLADMLEEGGADALKILPGIGDRIASRIAGFVETGHLVLLDQIRDEFVPENLFTRVFGVGPELARRIYDELGIETLEDLEVAAYDGRLEAVEGIGPRRVQAMRAQLHALLSQQSNRRARLRQEGPRDGAMGRSAQAPVKLLLNIDREYRERAAQGDLRKIAPRRFNPSGEAWLPVLNTERGPWRLSALYSNTARAHELGRTDDWVVVYAERAGQTQQQYTIVTEVRGDLEGLRIVRGREAECRRFYERRQAA